MISYTYNGEGIATATKIYITLQGNFYALYSWIDTINKNNLFFALINAHCT